MFDWRYVVRSWPILLQGLQLTLAFSASGCVIAAAWGLLLALIRLRRTPVLSPLATAYVELLRNTPMLNQLYLVFFGFPSVPSFAAAVIALGGQHGAYFSEIYRAGLQSVSPRQIEAGKALGMTNRSIVRRILLPQTLRHIIPLAANQLIVLVKDTSLIAAIGVGELTLTGRTLAERSAASYEMFLAIGVLYLGLTSSLALSMRYLERRLRLVQ